MTIGWSDICNYGAGKKIQSPNLQQKAKFVCISVIFTSSCIVTPHEGQTSSSKRRKRETWVTWGAFDQSVNKPVSMLTCFRCFCVHSPSSGSYLKHHRVSQCLCCRGVSSPGGCGRRCGRNVWNGTQVYRHFLGCESRSRQTVKLDKGGFYRLLAFYTEIKESTWLIISNPIVVFPVAVHVL